VLAWTAPCASSRYSSRRSSGRAPPVVVVPVVPVEDERGQGVLRVREPTLLDRVHGAVASDADPERPVAPDVLLDPEVVAQLVGVDPEPALGPVDEPGIQDGRVGAPQLDPRPEDDRQSLHPVVRPVDREVELRDPEPGRTPGLEQPAGPRAKGDDEVALPAEPERVGVHQHLSGHAGRVAVEAAADDGDRSGDLTTREEAQVAVDHQHAPLHPPLHAQRPAQDGQAAVHLGARRDPGLTRQASHGGAVVEVRDGGGVLGGEPGHLLGRGWRRPGRCRERE
jgi:hypothetical protein